MRRVSLIPRKSRCLILIGLLASFQLFSLLIYSVTDASTREEHKVLSQIDSLSVDFSKARTFIDKLFASKEEEQDFNRVLTKKMLEIDVQDKKYWKFQNLLTHTTVQLPVQQFKTPQKLNNFDPRFTYSVYLNYIKHQFQKVNPQNDLTLQNDTKKVYVPFHWADWVDLSALNEYLILPELERPSCDFLYPRRTQNKLSRSGRRRIDGHPIPPKDDAELKKQQEQAEKLLESKSIPQDHSAYCLSNEQYIAQPGAAADTSVLPGFNVVAAGLKGTWDKKLIQLKSFLYSTFEPPSSIVFLSDSGIYEVFTEQEKQRLSSSELIELYLAENPASEVVSLDPVAEFVELQRAVPAQKLANELGGTLDDLLLADPDSRLHLNHSMFVYNHEKIVAEYEATMEQRRLTSKQQLHYSSLKNSQSISSLRLKKHFEEVGIQGNTPNTKESGLHFDWRFFNGFISLSQVNELDDVAEKKRIILHRLLKTWLQFTYRTNIITWILHGSLLSWYWDGVSFPWDVDIDVQMPMMELDRFSLMFNNSLIVENIAEGYGRFYVDCSAYLTHRTKGNGRNNIDARFIDVDSGFYIDITGLTLTNTQISDRYKTLIDQNKVSSIISDIRAELVLQKNLRGRKAKEELQRGVSKRYLENLSLQAYNCRNNHFYLLPELSPLRVSLIEGTKTLIPNDFKSILKLEYTRGMTTATFNRHVYLPHLRLWLPFESVYRVLKTEVELVYARTSKRPSRSNRVTLSKLIKLLKEIDEEMIFKLLTDEEILKEFYLTKDITLLHQQEMEQIENKKVDRNFVVEQIINRKFDPLRKDMFMFRQEVLNLGEAQTTVDDDELIRRRLELAKGVSE